MTIRSLSVGQREHAGPLRRRASIAHAAIKLERAEAIAAPEGQIFEHVQEIVGTHVLIENIVGCAGVGIVFGRRKPLAVSLTDPCSCFCRVSEASVSAMRMFSRADAEAVSPLAARFAIAPRAGCWDGRRNR